MPVFLTRRRLLGTAAAATTAVALGDRAGAQDPVKAGFIYVGPVGDHGWTYRHDVGRRAVEEALGDGVTTTFVESVSEGPDAERVIRQLATTGHDIVFTTSFGFMNATVRVARQFPDVKFEHATGYQRGPNLATYNARFYEGRAVIGTIAGHKSESGIVGYIGSFPIPEVVMGINAFMLAAQKVRPDIQIRIVWVNSWYDPGKEADAAKTLIDQGADIISQHTDSPAPLQVAEERGVWGFGQASDMSRFAPNAQLTAIVDNWDPYYIERVQAVIDGTWEPVDIWHGLKEGMVEISPYGPAVTPEMAEAADKVKDAIIAGELHPFQGPIRNQAGEQVVAEGETLGDEQLLRMDWYVQGIQGRLAN
ncbi:MAG TPA: BMP family ABC transporter substrate-binding protein [Geminicoccaceae bacterium]|nr:BMP family ABC transporter substrate-binding protein [Geminicoccaceae bacterium]